MYEYIMEDLDNDKFGNDKLTYGYSRFLSPKYKGKGHGKIRLNQCKNKCWHPNFQIPILHNNTKYESKGAGRMQVYSCKLKAMGLSKCKQCNYITAVQLKPGTRCNCCGRILSFSVRHNDKDKSEFYIEPIRIE